MITLYIYHILINRRFLIKIDLYKKIIATRKKKISTKHKKYKLKNHFFNQIKRFQV